MSDIRYITACGRLLWPKPVTAQNWGVAIYYSWQGIPGAAGGHALGPSPACPVGVGGTCQAFLSSFATQFANPLEDAPVNTISSAVVSIPGPPSNFGVGYDRIEMAKSMANDSLQAAVIAALVAAGVPVPNSI